MIKLVNCENSISQELEMFTVEQPIHLHFIISPAHARPQRLARGPALGRAIREEAPPRLRRARSLLPGRSLRRHQQHLGDVLRELCRQIRLIAYLMYDKKSI